MTERKQPRFTHLSFNCEASKGQQYNFEQYCCQQWFSVACAACFGHIDSSAANLTLNVTSSIYF